MPEPAPNRWPVAGSPAFRRWLTALFALAVAVSIVHYVDNVTSYADYPRSGTLPNPSAFVIGAAWFAFTALGVAGLGSFRRDGPSARAALLLGAYSGSGLIGFLHYAVPGATGMPWWRQLHIVADILCGLALFAMAILIARAAPTRATARSTA